MNLYECILNVANYIKSKDKVKELIEKYKSLESLKSNFSYNFYFSLVDGKEIYGFFAPNIAMQIINNIYKNNDFEIISKKVCELIINNQEIKEYVEASTQVNEIVTKEIMSFFGPKEFTGDIKSIYAHNKLSEKLGYIGFIDNLKCFAEKGDEIKAYAKERTKIVEESAIIFPIYKFNCNFLKNLQKNNISFEIVDSFERFNLLLYIINRIIYNDIFDNIINIRKEDIEVINKKEKENIICLEMAIKNNKLLIKDFPVIIIEDIYYFSYSYEIKFEKERMTTKCKCFTVNLNERNALSKISIVNSVGLFEEGEEESKKI